MKIERPNSLKITPEESQELEYLRVTIERAIKDGVITRIEFESIKMLMFSNKKNNPDQILRQVTLYRNLVVEKLNNSELIFESPQ
ncbi:MAG: hypothetical protein EWV49_08495 [Microcystis aeruginosa Ma_QC_Ch_20071001_S25]|jgi:hypothetical protein|uniref:Uncharacterized protein n=2 Tax=Microcystis aeruginosa TaxID=1126 RepID=A0A552FL16_MICAE|nr:MULTISPECIES: hypothetical protein [unclassified Microcystis]MCA2762975.1 hypothetical protein [Microcystis sp. M151S2]TRU44176.1 MAG: hypothetical protein EWV57_23140 [Microcystis aeruginosa Ma_QC_Ch_20071001_S25D]TRU47418.1 MAG: hypothetical protein EWV91_11025 [Microcystis aeruginosa Ma_QC_Ca_00000000_S207]TRU50818.1 MAG: hypothetical protein EWV49_08495 [Microcystis aeruginosa Ma_QC_Ch_20071001_S25]TRU57709.1 MAG: hypothetical protein EWV90_20210 [Microcystis aeruginosa Ma_QC_Ch_2007100